MHHIVAESIVPAAEKVTISDQHVVIVESLLGHMATSHLKESTGRQPPNSQQEAAATVQKRAAGTFVQKEIQQLLCLASPHNMPARKPGNPQRAP